ncbi:MAG: TonB-dependent receptor plug domain-containing protein [Bacteroidia bacterium]|nr:TonB-dependent receptor plug domain-containing protein [Bacteroidia bacterium]
MVPFFEELQEVVISNYIVPGVDKLNNGDFALNIPKYNILPGLIDADVLQSVQAFPGIMSVNETVSNINIRGGTHDQNLILWDGIKMYQSGHFFGLISMYNPQITNKVRITKNGTDASMTDGVSGSIAMMTNPEVNREFKAEIGLNLIDFNVYFDVPVGRSSSFQIAARKAISDLIETPTYDRFFDRIEQDTEVAANEGSVVNSDKSFDFYDTSLRWLSRISDKDELRLNFILVANELKFDESAQVDQLTQSRTSSLDQNSIAGGLFYRRTWNEAWRTELEVFETDYKLKAINVNVLDSQRFLQENKVSETSAKISVIHNLNQNLNVTSGYHFVETEVTNLDDVDEPLYRFLVSEVVRTHAGFVQLDWTTNGGNTHLKLGSRYTFIDKFEKSLIEPRLSFSQRFLDFFTFELMGEMKHQNTSQVINFQNDFLGVEKRRWQLSNDDDIPILRSTQLSAGISFEHSGWLVDAAGYFKKVDGITSQSQGFQNQYEFSKTDGSYEVKGLDMLFRKQIDELSIWLSYSLMDNKYTFEELENEVFRSNYDITHSLSSGFSLKWNALQIAAGLNWHSGKPTTPPVEGQEIIGEEINYDSTNNADLEDYLRLDASAMYDFSLGGKSKAKFGLSVWNILDKENAINNFYRYNNESLTETIQRSLGITPNAVFRVFF